MSTCHVPDCQQPTATTLTSGVSLCDGHNRNRQEAFDRIRANKRPREAPSIDETEKLLVKTFQSISRAMKRAVDDQALITDELEAIAHALETMNHRLRHLEDHICDHSAAATMIERLIPEPDPDGEAN